MARSRATFAALLLLAGTAAAAAITLPPAAGTIRPDYSEVIYADEYDEQMGDGVGTSDFNTPHPPLAAAGGAANDAPADAPYSAAYDAPDEDDEGLYSDDDSVEPFSAPYVPPHAPAAAPLAPRLGAPAARQAAAAAAAAAAEYPLVDYFYFDAPAAAGRPAAPKQGRLPASIAGTVVSWVQGILDQARGLQPSASADAAQPPRIVVLPPASLDPETAAAAAAAAAEAAGRVIAGRAPLPRRMGPAGASDEPYDVVLDVVMITEVPAPRWQVVRARMLMLGLLMAEVGVVLLALSVWTSMNQDGDEEAEAGGGRRRGGKGGAPAAGDWRFGGWQKLEDPLLHEEVVARCMG